MGVISIDEAAAIAAEYRERTAEKTHLPGEGVTAMDMDETKIEEVMDIDDSDDSEESETSDETTTQKRKRDNDGVANIQNANKGKDDDDLSVETVRVQSGSGLYRT